MTLAEAEQYLRVCGIPPTLVLITLVKSVWNEAYMSGYTDAGRHDRD